MKCLLGRPTFVIAIAILTLTASVVALLYYPPWPTGQRPDDAVSRDRSAKGLARTPGGEQKATCPIQLRDVTRQTDISFRHTDGSEGEYHIFETVTSGLALFDYDGDGLIDIYFPNGALWPHRESVPAPRDALYKNLGDFHFQDVTDQAGLGCSRFGLGATVGDYDNDGHADLYVSNFGPNVLYRNNGDGTFSDLTDAAGVANGEKLGAGVCFLDAEADGNLDLFVASYLRFSTQVHYIQYREGYPEYISPKCYPPEAQVLFRSDGDGTFTDTSESSGISRHPGKGMGLVCADFDKDGDTDIFLLNDVFENFCFQNDGAGRFEEVSLFNGFKFNGNGLPLGSMGVDCGDYDNDGWLDLYQTSYQAELPVLFRNLGTGNFADVTMRTGAGQGIVGNVKWGCGLIDFDNDGYRDLFVAMGHLQDQIDHYDGTTSFRSRNVVLRNTGGGEFENVSDQVGDGIEPEYSSRGTAFDDLDNDGDIDVVVLNTREQPTVLRNVLSESGGNHHWLQIQLRGVNSNRDGVGAQVTVSAGDLTQCAEVHSGRSYQSHYGSRLHFGLDQCERVDRIEVRWVGGGTDVLEAVGVDQRVTITEGETVPAVLHR